MHQTVSGLGMDMGRLLESQEFADIAFVVEEQEVRCHKWIVSSRCSQFQVQPITAFQLSDLFVAAGDVPIRDEGKPRRTDCGT